MSVVKNSRTGRWDVRIQYMHTRIRGGSHDTEELAQKAEKKKLAELKALEKLNIDNCGKYEPAYEQTDESLVRRMIRRFKAKQAERRKDKQTTEKLEAL